MSTSMLSLFCIKVSDEERRGEGEGEEEKEKGMVMKKVG